METEGIDGNPSKMTTINMQQTCYIGRVQIKIFDTWTGPIPSLVKYTRLNLLSGLTPTTWKSESCKEWGKKRLLSKV
uniref:Uncharacterized protein n=1 Tax=Arundo donax TaxID=35708 RepID=A0A0A8YQX1_ARUDO